MPSSHASQNETNEIIKTAINYINAGLTIIPVEPPTLSDPKTGKKSLIAEWQKRKLSSDEFLTVTRPSDNIGVVTGKASNLICIDIDRSGAPWYIENEDKLGSPLVEKTGNGYHLYYRYPKDISFIPSINKYAPGVEIKADGGRYVVTAPSIHYSGKTYEMPNGLTLLDLEEFDELPAWLLSDILKRGTNTSAKLESLVAKPNGSTLDHASDIEGATRYLIQHAPRAISGNHGNEATFVVASTLKNFGLSESTAFTLLKTHYNPHCKPPWEENDLKTIVGNAFKYAKYGPSLSIRNDFSEISANGVHEGELGQEGANAGVVGATERYKKISAQSFLEMEIPKKEHIIGPFVRQGLSMVYAPSGVGKTYFAMGLSFAIATNGRFLNWQCEIPQKVIYFDGELAAHVLQDRLKSFLNSNKWPETAIFDIVTPDMQGLAMPDLSTKDGQVAAEALIGDAEFVVIDNLSTLCRSGEENSAEAWMPVQTWLLKLRAMGKSVLLVHHTGKGESASPRGSSKREDVLDLIIGLKSPQGHKVTDPVKFEMTFRKSRHLRRGDHLDGVEVTAEFTEFGWKVNSLESTNLDKIRNMYFDLKMKKIEIAAELGLSRAYISKIIKKLETEGKGEKGPEDYF